MSAALCEAEDRVRNTFKDVSTGVRSLTKPEERLCLKVGEVAKEVLARGVYRFAYQADQHPCSRTTQSDGTPITVTDRIREELGSGTVFMRRGRACHEFQVGCSYYRCAKLDVRPRILLREPVPMTAGKSAMSEWAILQRDSVSLRQAGHLGPAVEHYCWDRAKFSALTRIAKCFHAQERFPAAGGVSSKVLSLSQFVVTTGCSLHDVNKAQEWGMHAEFHNKEILRDCWVVCESLRNSLNLVKKCIGAWLAESVVFVDPLPATGVEEIRCLFTALGVEPEVVEFFTEVLELRFEGDKLLVSRACDTMPDLSTQLQAYLLKGWSVNRFTESRWQTIGNCTRGLVVGLLTGLGGLLGYILNDTGESQFYLKGWKRLKDDRLAFVVTLALCSRVSDSLQAELITDARVASRFQELVGIMEEEVDWLLSLPWSTMRAVASIGGMTVPELRAKVHKVAHVTVGFIQERVFSQLQQHPFSLAVGDIDQLAANLIDLEAGDEPEEQVAKQLWLLMHMEYPKHRLIGVLLLIHNLQWSTLTAEQLHASAALMMRHHPDYGMSTLLSRTMTVMARKLLPVPTDDEKLLDKTHRKLAREVATCPQRCTGKALFIRDIFQVARSKYGTGVGRPKNLTTRIIAGAANKYNKQSEKTKRTYSAMSHAQSSRAVESRNGRIEALRGTIDITSMRIAEAATSQSTLTLSSCCWGETDFEIFVECMGSARFSGRQFLQKREASLAAPEALAGDVLMRMHEFKVPDPAPEVLAPWLQTASLYRAFFEHSAFRFTIDGQQQVWKFCFAKQSPRFVRVSRMYPVLPSQSFVSEVSAMTWDTMGDLHAAYAFTMDIHNVVSAATFGEVDENSVDVIDGLEFVGDSLLRTQEYAVPFKVFVDELPDPSTGAVKKDDKKRAATSSAKHQKEVVEELPWVEKFWREELEAPEEPDQAEEIAEMPAEDWMTDQDIEAVFSEVDRAREYVACATGSVVNIDDFPVTVLGGKWTKQNKQKSFDAVSAAATGAYAIKFCQDQNVFASARFDIEAYTMVYANMLGRGWAHKMQHFLNLSAEHEADLHVFTADEIASYSEPSEFTAAADVLKGHWLAPGRIRQIRALFSA